MAAAPWDMTPSLSPRPRLSLLPSPLPQTFPPPPPDRCPVRHRSVNLSGAVGGTDPIRPSGVPVWQSSVPCTAPHQAGVARSMIPARYLAVPSRDEPQSSLLQPGNLPTKGLLYPMSGSLARQAPGQPGQPGAARRGANFTAPDRVIGLMPGK